MGGGENRVEVVLAAADIMISPPWTLKRDKHAATTKAILESECSGADGGVKYLLLLPLKKRA